MSQAIPGSRASTEFKTLTPEVKEVIREKIVQDPSLVLTIKDLKAENERLAKQSLDAKCVLSQNEDLKSQLDALTNNQSQTLLESRDEAERLLIEIASLQRQIDSLSTQFFTFNDNTIIDKIQHLLTVIPTSFNRRTEQIIQEPSTTTAINCTVG